MPIFLISILISFISCQRFRKYSNKTSNQKPQFDVGDWWTDTNGNFIQGHGGIIEKIENYDCFNNGTKWCWVWYGEDKTTGTTGIHVYASTNLYVWEDKGMALNVHNVMPEKLDDTDWGIVHDLDNLEELKRRANLPKSNEHHSRRPYPHSTHSKNEVSDDDIDMARNFLRPYVTEIDEDGKFVKFDEEHLIYGFVYLFKTYVIIERPKMIYNKKYNNYVLLFHSDGPRDSDIVNWIHNGMPGWQMSYSYNRAMIGFAVSDNPFGPFKLVNVQRMHWVKGYHDDDPGMARDMGTYVDRNSEESDEDEIAYVIYSSEGNEFLYISRLDDTYTTWDVPQDKAKDGVDFKSRLIGWSTWREAPAIFRHNGYYYLMSSGTTGWAPNAATYHRSTMLFGPYEEMGNPCEGSGSERTFDSQSTYFIRYNAKKGQFIYFGDRWFENDLDTSRYVLLPVEIDEVNNKFKLHYTEHWSYEDWFESSESNENK